MIRIALCDDSELQLEVTESVLNNYIQTRNEEITVELYRSGEELIRTVREKGGYDVYILDMIMPGMNGMEVASLLRINYVTLENRKLKYVLTNGRVLMGKTLRTRF